MGTAVNACGSVWLRYDRRVAEIDKRLAGDRAVDPKSPPNESLVMERRRLLAYMRSAEDLAVIFKEEGL